MRMRFIARRRRIEGGREGERLAGCKNKGVCERKTSADNLHQPERGGGCAGQREEEGRGSFPNVAIDRPVGL